MASETVHYRTCPFCEATCGLEVTVRDGEVASVRGDAGDVFSRGFLCPKSQGLKQLAEDPDVVRRPLVRRDGELREASWEHAFAEVDRRLGAVLEAGDRDAVAVYLGNPSAHSLGPMIYGQALVRALGTKNVYTASTVDQMPKQVAAGLMFGGGLSVPVPDVDRTDHLVILGANPLVSNGSLLTAPDMRGRLRAIRERGGKVVVIDPRRTRTAREASEHHFIRPGTDAALLLAIANALIADGLAATGRLAEHANGAERLTELVAPFTPEAVAPLTAIPAAETRRIAAELAAAERAAVYGRIGTTAQRFGTLASWAVDVVNYLTGNLDREGGAMLPLAAVAQRNSAGRGPTGKGVRLGRWRSRVSGRPETFGELPVACLGEEIATPGEGQVRALVTIAGNPVVSSPDAAGLERAIEGLDFQLAVDLYVNETTRHADVILPAPDPLGKAHYDFALYQLAVRSIANYSPPVLPRPPGQPDEWEIIVRLAGIAAGQGPDADVDAWDRLVLETLVRREVALPGSRLEGREPEELIEALGEARGPERVLDFMLRAGPFGDAFGAEPDGLTLARVAASPHGIDLGPMRPRIPDALRTPSGKIELAPEEIAADLPRLAAEVEAAAKAAGAAPARAANGDRADGIVLIGRRQLRSNNSWMHNLPALVRDADECTLWLNPADAGRLGIADGARARVRSAAGELEATVEVTDEIMPGVASIPHGWGHDVPGARMRVAAEHAGVNSNLVSPAEVDPLSGNAVLNGISVEVEVASAEEPR
ncbi:MAG TPA: molybdopterin-dependent oxidoreductase [Solirubrobacterales bacterium]|nr:molybdopterin-dependent oxidoreductase [Solirubrobacterales bacterium]